MTTVPVSMRNVPILLFALLGVTLSCMAEAQQSVRVSMTTSLGDIELEVYPESAPVTANHFLRLVDGAHLDGGTFYRAVSPENDNGSPPISVIQGGIGERAAPFPPIAHESTETTGLRHLDGSISMARAAVGTATTEFFICGLWPCRPRHGRCPRNSCGTRRRTHRYRVRERPDSRTAGRDQAGQAIPVD
jgi:cyclophilin family peptidyl-prolyl cis-trans isomerase